jgi:nucleotide-binding universal stress UspA family protein
MKNIILPVDFSTASYNASRYAVSLATVFKAKVTFINVVPPLLLYDEEAAPAMLMQHERLIEENRALIEDQIQFLSKKSLVTMEGFVAEGSPFNIIQEIALEKDADLIIMGMKGKGKSNSIFGSTTNTVIRKSSFPVLVIPEATSYQSIDKITFASDFNPETEMDRYALLENIAQKYNSFIQVLNVQKDEIVLSDNEVIGKMKTHFAFTYLNHDFTIIEDDNVVEGIIDYLKENRADLLVMMAQKHSLIERLFGEIYTTEMSRQTKIPLLVLQNK